MIQSVDCVTCSDDTRERLVDCVAGGNDTGAVSADCDVHGCVTERMATVDG